MTNIGSLEDSMAVIESSTKEAKSKGDVIGRIRNIADITSIG